VDDLAIIIATRNRVDKLSKLLESINLLAEKPGQVIIVYSGDEVSSATDIFKYSINLTINKSFIENQIEQKFIGIGLLNKNINWVLFLDDDITVPINALEILSIKYLKNPNFADVYGFGLKIRGLEYRQRSKAVLFFLRFCGLYSNVSGAVLKSGHAQNYQNSLIDIETKWLNGISIWRTEALQHYSSRFSKIDYSAYEDVIFSYKISQNNRLIFASAVAVVNQNREVYYPLSFIQYRAGTYMRFIFVSENKELSKIKFLNAQFFRGLDFIINGELNIPLHLKLRKVCYIWCDLFLAILLKKDGMKLLRKRYN